MYAVLDTETTGLSFTSDRIIELAIIGLDAYGNKEWEWCSLINPERDTGRGLVVQIHQIYPRDVVDAPTFTEFAGHIAAMLAGRAIIAHNAKFDLGMLGAEFARLGVKLPPVTQICTAELARDCGFRPWRLENCCEVLGIELEGLHHALADARATWQLAQNLFDFSHDRIQSDVQAHLRAMIPWPTVPIVAREPVMRPILPSRTPTSRFTGGYVGSGKGGQEMSASHAAPNIEAFSIDREQPESQYLAAVEWALEDREIPVDQQRALDELRDELQLSDNDVHEVHMTFIRGLSGSMWQDGNISKHEQYDLDVVGKALRLDEDDIKYAREHPIELDLINKYYDLKAESKVVFTGEMSISRSEWTTRAKAAGLRVTGSVSGKTDYLVVPFGETGSSKSRKARALGVRVVSEQRFLRMITRLEQHNS